MHIIHIAAECYPVAKIGGLGDVIGALPKYLNQAGEKAQVVLPWYEKPFTQKHDFELVHHGEIYQGSRRLEVQVFKELTDELGFELFLIKIPGLLDRPEVYMYSDENEQFMAFQQAFLSWLVAKNIQPDIIHCHDHHTGLIPFLMYHGNDFTALKDIPTVATVHNGQYQGWMDWKKAILIPYFDTWKWGLLDWNKLINPLAALIKCCTAFTAVSEGYLKELSIQANGLESLFSFEKDKGAGIVNGIDTDIWNAQSDEMIAHHYRRLDVTKGKSLNKETLLNQTHIKDKNLPLISFIGRFADEKGADLLPYIIENICNNFVDKVNIFILGSGNKDLEYEIDRLHHQYPTQLAVYIGYKEDLAHQIYAASDFILMPSRVEPCGLNQLYAMRYGTIPMVHNTGGLRDTVVDLELENGSGIKFEHLDIHGIMYAVDRAVNLFQNKKQLQTIRRNIMNLGFSWKVSAQKYINLYSKLTSKKNDK